MFIRKNNYNFSRFRDNVLISNKFQFLNNFRIQNYGLKLLSINWEAMCNQPICKITNSCHRETQNVFSATC